MHMGFVFQQITLHRLRATSCMYVRVDLGDWAGEEGPQQFIGHSMWLINVGHSLGHRNTSEVPYAFIQGHKNPRTIRGHQSDLLAQYTRTSTDVLV